jgi:Tfp pilus assembly protein PilE
LTFGYAMSEGFWKGLRFLEIAIVAFCLMAVSAVVYYRFDNFMIRSIQSEVRFGLAQLYAAQMLYHEKHDHYAPVDVLLNKEKRVEVGQKYYQYYDKNEPLQDSFSIVAQGREGSLVAGELWQINEKNKLEQKQSLSETSE